MLVHTSHRRPGQRDTNQIRSVRVGRTTLAAQESASLGAKLSQQDGEALFQTCMWSHVLRPSRQPGSVLHLLYNAVQLSCTALAASKRACMYF